ncbi:DUF523 domain-containing protein [Poseidonibacter lekithochrous]|uniref:DUF523 domain-containing protein n=1 Tax=Poseidonibacter TaxID=2321187 RepID=UPI001C09D752|nr:MULTISPECIES: DUF523 domain-containing protein [Poseidonibacter]MBU3014794.1 DUF523 domain-containing protein [Poseidonibacter lekithochrous]MDO6828092.1 DUF523 domain-containing protein [Poseidonibacter sp. 1_MG-2023]
MKVLISSCLLGEDVRYDGNNSSIAMGSSFTFSQKEIFMDILCDNEIYSFCPEVSGGLGTPRLPAEIVSTTKPFKVETNNEEDVTIPFLIGAKNALDICKDDDIKVALLKSKSPSCGNIEIYDGTFSNTLVEGQGLTARLLDENGIKVFNETQLEDLKKFIETN